MGVGGIKSLHSFLLKTGALSHTNFHETEWEIVYEEINRHSA